MGESNGGTAEHADGNVMPTYVTSDCSGSKRSSANERRRGRETMPSATWLAIARRWQVMVLVDG